MNKLVRSHGEKLRPVKLFLDDVQKIVDILREATDKITLKTDEYELQDVKELTELGQQHINELEIIAHDHMFMSN